MPHDRNGKPLKNGDVVDLRCVVKSVSPSEMACNLQLHAIGGPVNESAPVISCNAGFVQLVEPGAPAEGAAGQEASAGAAGTPAESPSAPQATA